MNGDAESRSTPPIRLLRAADHRRMPWKNGLGVTLEIARDESGAEDVDRSSGDFAWRLSIADVATDGPFSRFVKIDRHLLLIEGRGVRLAIDGTSRTLDRLYQPIAFAGESTTFCTLLDGPVRDFNVMVDRRRFTASVRRLAQGVHHTLGPGALRFAIAFGGTGCLAVVTPDDATHMASADCEVLELFTCDAVRLTSTASCVTALVDPDAALFEVVLRPVDE